MSKITNPSKHASPDALQESAGLQHAKRKTLTAYNGRRDFSSVSAIEAEELREKTEQEEVVGRHKNNRQIHSKGAR